MTLFLPVHFSRSLFSRSLSSYFSSSHSLSYCLSLPTLSLFPLTPLLLTILLFSPLLLYLSSCSFHPPLTFSPPGQLLPSHTPPAIPFPAHSPSALPLTAAISSRLLSFRSNFYRSLLFLYLSLRLLSSSSSSPFPCFSLFRHALALSSRSLCFPIETPLVLSPPAPFFFLLTKFWSEIFTPVYKARAMW